MAGPGRRILDVAALLYATRQIARRHAGIRREQVDVWSRTSSVAWAAREQGAKVEETVRDQAGRVTLTVRAADALLKRLNESADGEKVGVERARENLVRRGEEKPGDEVGDQRGTVLGGERDQPGGSGEDVSAMTRSVGPEEVKMGAENEEVPEGVNVDVFQSPKMRRLMGGTRAPRMEKGRDDSGKPGFRSTGSIQPEKPPVAVDSVEDPQKFLDDTQDLASDIAQEADGSSMSGQEVSMLMILAILMRHDPELMG